MGFPRYKLLKKREELGLSRPDLAKLSGVSARTIESIEQGLRSEPKQPTIAKLAKGLGVPVDFFFTDDIPPPAEEPTRGRPATAKPDPGPKRGRGRPKK